MLLLLVPTLIAAPLCCCAVQELNERQSPDSSLGLNLRIMVVGMTGTGEVGSRLHAMRHKGNQMSLLRVRHCRPPAHHGGGHDRRRFGVVCRSKHLNE
jgi:hypothetical protein